MCFWLGLASYGGPCSDTNQSGGGDPGHSLSPFGLLDPALASLAGIPDNAWERIFAFTRAFVPRRQLSRPVLASADLRRVFRSGASLKTGGPDSWRKEDLLALPDSYLSDVVSLFQHVEGGGKWPHQLPRGHVTCLQKRTGQYHVANYRPVVVLSLLY